MMTSLLLAAILPAAAVFVLLELARRRWSIGLLPILAPASGYAIAYLVLFRALPWPARESRHWLFWSGLAIGLALMAAAWKAAPPPRRQLFLMLLMQAGLFFQLAPLFRHAWSAPEAVLWVFGIVFALFALGTALLRLSAHLPARAFLLLATGSFALLAPLLLVSGTLSLAQLAGGVASALGGVLLFTWRQPLPACTSALAWMCAYFLASLLAQGRFYAGLKDGPLALALLALPAAAWIAASWKGPRLQPAVFAAAWGLAAAAVALAASLSEPLEY